MRTDNAQRDYDILFKCSHVVWSGTGENHIDATIRYLQLALRRVRTSLCKVMIQEKLQQCYRRRMEHVRKRRREENLPVCQE